VLEIYLREKPSSWGSDARNRPPGSGFTIK
jgi:hypothetical protein